MKSFVMCLKKSKCFFLTSIFLLNFQFCSLNAFENKFIIEKECPIYKFENEKLLKISKNPDKLPKLHSENFEVKDVKKIKKSEYILLKNHEKQFDVLDDFYINKNCGYFLLENSKQAIKFDAKFFNKDEIEIVNKNIKKIDKEILSLCGAFGSNPQKEKFQEILLANKEDLKEIFKEASNFDESLDSLSRILFADKGFAHVFCGILKDEKISGPHYAARFLDLDQKNLIGLVKNLDNSKNFNIKKDLKSGQIFVNRSLSFISAKKEIRTKAQNSFILNDNFLDLLTVISKIQKIDFQNFALAQEIQKTENKQFESKLPGSRKSKNSKYERKDIKSCFYFEESNKNKIYKIVVNVKNQSLITLYPIFDEKAEKLNICKFL